MHRLADREKKTTWHVFCLPSTKIYINSARNDKTSQCSQKCDQFLEWVQCLTLKEMPILNLYFFWGERYIIEEALSMTRSCQTERAWYNAYVSLLPGNACWQPFSSNFCIDNLSQNAVIVAVLEYILTLQPHQRRLISMQWAKWAGAFVMVVRSSLTWCLLKNIICMPYAICIAHQGSRWLERSKGILSFKNPRSHKCRSELSHAPQIFRRMSDTCLHEYILHTT